MERAGVTQLLDRKSFISALGHLTKIASQVWVMCMLEAYYWSNSFCRL